MMSARFDGRGFDGGRVAVWAWGLGWGHAPSLAKNVDKVKIFSMLHVVSSEPTSSSERSSHDTIESTLA